MCPGVNAALVKLTRILSKSCRLVDWRGSVIHAENDRFIPYNVTLSNGLAIYARSVLYTMNIIHEASRHSWQDGELYCLQSGLPERGDIVINIRASIFFIQKTRSNLSAFFYTQSINLTDRQNCRSITVHACNTSRGKKNSQRHWRTRSLLAGKFTTLVESISATFLFLCRQRTVQCIRYSQQ